MPEDSVAELTPVILPVFHPFALTFPHVCVTVQWKKLLCDSLRPWACPRIWALPLFVKWVKLYVAQVQMLFLFLIPSEVPYLENNLAKEFQLKDKGGNEADQEMKPSGWWDAETAAACAGAL